MSDDHDLLAAMIEEEAAKPVASLSDLVNLANRAVALEETVKDLEQAYKEQKGLLHFIKTQRLPDAMFAVGQSEFTLNDGTKVTIEDFVSGSLPKEDPLKRQAAFVYLENTEGGADIIKNVVSMQFDKKQHNEALALAEELHDRGFDAKVTSDVHASTLKAFIREKLQNGEEIDYEKLGCQVGRTAKIKPAKK